jgi:small subunit ribosomal protein S8
MLTRIRNSNRARHPEVTFSRSNLKEEMCRILKREHFIKDYEVIKDNRQGKIKVKLAYGRDRESFINGLRCISRPGLRRYLSYKDLLKGTRRRPGLFILSTSKGVMTDKECGEAKAGGEVICEVW